MNRFAVTLSMVLLVFIAATVSVNARRQVLPPDNVPLPAAAAGFTTPALDADFTVIGGDYSDPATFINGCGADSQYRFFNIDGWWPGGYPPDRPCGESEIITDPVYGNWTLHIHAEPGSLQSLSYPTTFLNPLALGLGFPVGTYIEIMYRSDLPSLTQDGTPGIPIDIWQPARGVTFDGSYDPTHWLETALLETGGLNDTQPWNVGAGLTEWGGGPGPACNDVGCYTDTVLWYADQTVYNKLAFLVTSDGISNIWACWFWNDAPLGCRDLASATWPNPIHPSIFKQHDNPITITLGGYYYYNYDDGQWECCTAAYINPIDVYIAWIKVRECFNWKTEQCNGPMITKWSTDLPTRSRAR